MRETGRAITIALSESDTCTDTPHGQTDRRTDKRTDARTVIATCPAACPSQHCGLWTADAVRSLRSQQTASH